MRRSTSCVRVWAADGQRSEDLDEACGPTKSCKNMKDVTFDGLAEPGSDLGAAWREKLRREGKLSTAGGIHPRPRAGLRSPESARAAR